MSGFDNAGKQIERLTKIIEDNLTLKYDFPESFTVTLLKYSENIIFKISFDNDCHEEVVFRIHRPGYHDMDELNAELIWMDEISAETDIKLPLVYKGKDGEFIVDFEGYKCSVISFLYGTVLGKLDDDELNKAMVEMGEITAKLHTQSENRASRKKLKRFEWDVHNFFDNDGVWGGYRMYPDLTNNQLSVLEKCEKAIVCKLEDYGRTSNHYGLIHADLHFFNVIRNEGKNQIFDFDDCGYGFFMYDLGCTLVTYSKDLEKLTDAWVSGYEKVRRLSDEDKKMLPVFILIRRIVRLAWLASHMDSDTKKTVDSDYVDITIDMAQQFIQTN